MEKMMRYPYICKSKDGDVVFLITGKNLGIVLDDPKPIFVSETKERFGNTYVEDDCGDLLYGVTNITREYLQNTYGEVLSPEHVEFIIELGKNASDEISVELCTEYSKGSFFNFYTGPNGELYLNFFDRHLASDSGEKQITIPLPPKADKQKVSEWPQIGDEVVLAGDVCKVMSPTDRHGTVAVTNEKGFNLLVFKSDLSKPKTPEEELCDLLHEIWNENGGDFDDFVDIAIHHIIKKPQ